MAIKLTTTAEATKHVKCLTFGDSGTGKTTLCKTAPKPIIICAERGLLSLSDVDIPVIEVSNIADVVEAYEFVTGEDGKEFETVCLDSISDIAETLLAKLKEESTDPRQAYGKLNDMCADIIKKFRDIPDKHVYFTAKNKRIEDQFTGITSWQPSMPGQTLGPALPYLFDFVIPLRIGVTPENVEYRYLQTKADIQYLAKDRSGKLEPQEEPNLGKLFAKALDPKTKRK